MRIPQIDAIAPAGPTATRRTLITVIFVSALAMFLSGNGAHAQDAVARPLATPAICQLA